MKLEILKTETLVIASYEQVDYALIGNVGEIETGDKIWKKIEHPITPLELDINSVNIATLTLAHNTSVEVDLDSNLMKSNGDLFALIIGTRPKGIPGR